jgi:hypothetical protein
VAVVALLRLKLKGIPLVKIMAMRRSILKSSLCIPAFLIQDAIGKRAKPITAPVWLGVGLNASRTAVEGRHLFPVLSKVAEKNGRRIDDNTSLTWVNQSVQLALRDNDPIGIRFITGGLQRDETTGVALVYDFELVNAVPTTLHDGTTFGHAYYLSCATGVISILDGRGYWRILATYPFFLKQAIDGGRMDRSQVQGWSGGAAMAVAERFHVGQGPSIKSLFVDRTRKFANWKDGYSEKFVRVLPVRFSVSVRSILRDLNIDNLLTPELIGIISSSELSSAFDIAVLPYVDTDALRRFQFQVADYGNLPQEPPADDQVSLRVGIEVDMLRREATLNQRQGFTAIRRGIRMAVDFMDLDGRKIASYRVGSVESDRVFSIEDATPSRDFQFFESAFEKAISGLLSGLARSDKTKLASVGVNLDENRLQTDRLLKEMEGFR